jgi:DnaJ-class molecular chaperone
MIHRGEGLEHLGRQGKWSLIFHIIVDTPTKLSSDQKKLYEAILLSEGSKPKKGWLEELFGG